MRTFFNFLFCFVFLTNLYSQNFSLDNTFGDNGVVINTSVLNKIPVDVIYENDKYFIVLNENIIISYNYDGTLNSGFGVSGILNLNIDNNETFRNSGVKLSNGSIFVFGQKTTNLSSNTDGFVVKLSTSGVLDSSFGINGKAVLDFGENEEQFNDIYITNTNEIYAIGTRLNSIFLSKINSNGNLNFDFDNNGYKVYTIDSNEISSKGVSVFEQNSELLLIGNARINAKYLILIKIDLDGNLIQNYGINGINKIETVSSSNTSEFNLIRSIIKDDNLYFSYNLAYSFTNNDNWLGRYNLLNENLEANLFSLPFNYPSYQINENDKIYYTGSVRCSSSQTNCQRDFFLKKKNFDGSDDLTFNSIGTYLYNFFPSDLVSDDQSSVFLLQEDGKILLMGYLYNPFSSEGTGLTMIRIIDSTLKSDSYYTLKENIKIYPNPCIKTISIENKKDKKINKVKIFDDIGRIVLNQNTNFSCIDISNLNQGIYYVQIDIEGAVLSKKIIKE